MSASCLRYGHARSRANDTNIHFHQRNAENNGFPDAHFDVVFSSMFLHELPAAAIANAMAEAHRVLKPGRAHDPHGIATQ